MRKMKLDIDSLAVESFPTRAVDTDARSTVRGHQIGTFPSRDSACDTCQLSCTGSCATGYNCQQVC